MTTQLTLVPLPRRNGRPAATPAWQLDDRTRAIGMAGIARARAVLAEHRRAAEPGAEDPVAA